MKRDDQPALRFPPEMSHADEQAWRRAFEAQAANDLHVLEMFREPVEARARRLDRKQRVVDWILIGLLVAVLMAIGFGWGYFA